MAGLVEQRQTSLDVARRTLKEGPLAEEPIEVHPVARQRRLDPRQQQRHRPVGGLGGRQLEHVRDLCRQVAHIVALVPALGRLVAARPRLHRFAEQPDLRPGVVDVVLALHVVAMVLEDPSQRVSVGGMAAAGGDQRAGRVGRDELDLHPQHRLGATGAEPFAGVEHRPCARADTRRQRGSGSRNPGPATS